MRTASGRLTIESCAPQSCSCISGHSLEAAHSSAGRLTLAAVGTATLLLLVAVSGGGTVRGCCASALVGVPCLLMQTERTGMGSDWQAASMQQTVHQDLQMAVCKV